MTKNLFICFLAPIAIGICLFGSKTTAKVADSPGAYFLHRSVPPDSPDPGDTHRGGVSRPDTTPLLKKLKEEQTVLIYGEILPLETYSELTLQLWEESIDQGTHNPSLEYRKIPLHNGSLKTGNPGYYWFKMAFPLKKTAYLSIQVGETELVQSLLVYPGDSIKFQWNEHASLLAFSGPAADWMTLQQDLLRLECSRSMEWPTVVHSYNPLEMFRDEQELKLFGASQKMNFGRKVEVWKVDPGEMLQDHKEIYQTRSLRPVKALALIRSYAGRIPTDRLDLLEAEQLAKAWKHYWVMLGSLNRYSDQDSIVRGELVAFFNSSLQDFNPVEQYPDRLASPAYLEMNYEKIRLMRALLDKDAAACISSLYEGKEREMLLTKNLFRTFPASGLSYEEALALTMEFEDASLRESVVQFLEPFAPNAPINTFKFVTQEGEPIGLDSFRGKTILVHLWFTGCKASSAIYTDTLRALQEEYADADDMAIVSISIDANQKIWLHGLEEGTYSHPSWKQLHVGRIGLFHPFLITYGIYSYPHVMLIDKEGKLVKSGGFERNTEVLKSAIEAVR